MPVSLSIKNVPDELAELLRQRARRAHRSLQGELLTILEEAVGWRRRRMTAGAALRRARELGPERGPEAARGRRDPPGQGNEPRGAPGDG